MRNKLISPTIVCCENISFRLYKWACVCVFGMDLMPMTSSNSIGMEHLNMCFNYGILGKNNFSYASSVLLLY